MNAPSVLGINDQGLVAIKQGHADRTEEGYAWWRGTRVALPGLGGSLVRPIDLNDRNAIVGVATAADGSFHAAMWTVSAA